jgi:hypothetical protein
MRGVRAGFSRHGSACAKRRNAKTMAQPQFVGAPQVFLFSPPPRFPPRIHHASHEERTYGELPLYGARCCDVGFVHQRQWGMRV